MANVKGGAVKDQLALDVALHGFAKLKAAGSSLTCRAVEVAAHRAGCSVRQMWRYVNGQERHEKRAREALTERQLAQVCRAGGNLHLAWSQLRRKGEFTQGYRTFLRAFAAVDPALAQGVREGRGEMLKLLPFLELPKPAHFLEVVEIDHAKLSQLKLYDPVTKHVGHPWATVVIDVWSRTVLGYAVTLGTDEREGAATSESAFLALADALLTYGAFEWIRYDQGADFMGPVAEALDRLGLGLSPCPAYSPWTKPYVERFFRTLKHTMLPEIAAAGFELEEVA